MSDISDYQFEAVFYHPVGIVWKIHCSEYGTHLSHCVDEQVILFVPVCLLNFRTYINQNMAAAPWWPSYITGLHLGFGTVLLVRLKVFFIQSE